MRLQRSAAGIVLLDALIAILIFSVGIVGMVSLQGTARKLSGDAKDRSDAAMFADQVIANMWGYDLTTTGKLAADYAGAAGTGGTKYTDWAATLNCTAANSSTCLPGASANPPSIVVTGNNLVTVTVFWTSSDSSVHNYVSTSQLTR